MLWAAAAMCALYRSIRHWTLHFISKLFLALRAVGLQPHFIQISHTSNIRANAPPCRDGYPQECMDARPLRRTSNRDRPRSGVECNSHQAWMYTYFSHEQAFWSSKIQTQVRHHGTGCASRKGRPLGMAIAGELDGVASRNRGRAVPCHALCGQRAAQGCHQQVL